MIDYLKEKDFVKSAAISIVLLLISLTVNFFAGTYATDVASNPVTDIVLSNIRVYDVDFFFVYGAVLLWTIVTFLCFFRPQIIPFTLKSISLFVLIRSGFVTLTHIGPFPTHISFSPTNIISLFTFGGDFFFSGHTGLPFLLALIFWKNKFWRYFFLVCSVLFGAVVLMGHLHYSIDVASAFFITYSIYHLSLFLFKTDKLIFDHGLNYKKVRELLKQQVELP